MKKKYLLLILVLLVTKGLFSQENIDALVINEQGNVGVNTLTPEKNLDVSGDAVVRGDIQALIDDKIKSVLEYLIPVGAIMPFGGDSDHIPDGWLLCDGSEFTKTDEKYEDLFSVIGFNFGSSDNGASKFKIPDLRGQFLRGTNYGAGNDPDADERTEANGSGNDPNEVGSTQGDAFQGHWHTTDRPLAVFSGGANKWTSGGGDYNTAHVTDPVADDKGNGDPRTTSETRPKNVYVNFIIKY